MCGHHWVESKAKSYEDTELGKRRDRRRGWEQCYLGRSHVDLGRSWTLELCAHQAATGVTSQRPQPLSPPHTLSWCLLQDSRFPPLSPQCPDPSPTLLCLNQPSFPSTKQNILYLAFFKWFLPCLWPQSPETIKAHLNIPLLKSVSIQDDLSCDSQDCIPLLCGAL